MRKTAFNATWEKAMEEDQEDEASEPEGEDAPYACVRTLPDEEYEDFEDQIEQDVGVPAIGRVQLLKAVV